MVNDGVFRRRRSCYLLALSERQTIMTKMTAQELEAFLYSHFPEMDERLFRVEQVTDHFAQIRMKYHPHHLRPGGTISGPTLMMLADTAMYLVLLEMIGPVALAVTTNVNI